MKRITSITKLHYISGDCDDAVNIDIALSQKLQQGGQAYVRKMTLVPGIPSLLDFGWVGDPFMVVVHNRSESNIMLQHNGVAFTMVPPGYPFPLFPVAGSVYHLTADIPITQSEYETKLPVTLYAFPG